MRKWRYGVALGSIAGLALALFAVGNSCAENPALQIRNGEVGLVISSISYGLGPDGEGTPACPRGMSQSFIDGYRATHTDGAPRPGKSERDYGRRISVASSTAPNGQNLCAFPMAAPDSSFQTVSGRNIPVPGVNLDGQVARSSGRAAPGTCAHDDFAGADGAQGIDNQFYRVMGCTQAYQSRGQANTFEIEMLTGSWGILLDIKGVDNLRNDPDVTVGIHASADPIQVSAARVPLAYATYAADADPRFRATAQGRIVNGVLTTDPVDVRFHWSTNGLRLERPLRDARLQLTFTAEGQATGYLSGYTPVQEFYDNDIGFSAGVDLDGNPASQQRILGTSVGKANVLGYTCHGLFQAMQRLADGHRDPNTGNCTSLSTQYRIRAIPAFVIGG